MNQSGISELFANRYELLRKVGSGGMGTVYQAHDLHTGRSVALKLLTSDNVGPLEIDRFTREAKLLAELRHPGIVGYVAHGVAAEGQPYLAMEWLEGEDLSQRLRRGPLSLSEVLVLLHKVTEALAFAHSAGIVHRDLKPSNLFLRGGQVGNVAILDFGIARRTQRSQQMTRTGSVIGTPDYMAPEQARGERNVSPAADVFSLGCVIYECISGLPPFTAPHLAAVLGKILFAAPERLTSPLAAVPAALDELVMSMLIKDSAERPRSGAVLLDRLHSLAGLQGALSTADEAGISRVNLAGDEQRLLCVLLVTPRSHLSDDEGAISDEAQRSVSAPSALRSGLAAYGAQVETLADGSLVVTLPPTNGGATEQVARAVQCALYLRERFPEMGSVLATGRGVMGARLPMGEVLDRAGQMLQEQLALGRRSDFEYIVIDDVSAGLLGGRYVLERVGTLFTLQGEAAAGDASRPLLGRPTPCVGRESELGILEGALLAAIEEGSPRAILITAAPGLGKSRLRHEFQRRIEQRSQNVQVWIGGCDPLSAGSPYGPISRALRTLCKVKDGEPLDVRREKLWRRIREHLPAVEADHVADFLGELCGVHYEEGQSLKLRAARQDPRVMSDQVTQAFLRFLQAECLAQPVVLVLEDLQWGDALSIKLIGAALLGLGDAPMLIVGVARPEVYDQFPNLWLGHVQQLPLRPLHRRASERMAQQLLSDLASPATVNRIVERAAGNPLWLEELIRATAEGNRDETPQTVLAMLQSRIGQLPGEARQVLRASSIFGETFWQEGVTALVGNKHGEDVAQAIEMLVQRELLAINSDSRYPGQRELRFRHTLMRDAAYSLLTDDDRLLGHRLAGAYLEAQHESDSAVLAEHARRGGERERAVRFFARAAEHALAGNDITAAQRYAQAGLSCQPEGELLGLLRCIEATANLWGGELQVARAAGLEALAILPPGSTRWCQAILSMWLTTTYLGQPELFSALREQFKDVVPLPDAMSAYVEAASFLIVMTSLVGQAEESRFFLSRLETMAAPFMETDVAVRGWVKYARGVYCHWIENDLWQKAELATESIAASDLIGDRRMRCLALTSLGLAQMGMGAYIEGTATFRMALDIVRKLSGEKYLWASTTAFFAAGITDRCDPSLLDEAIELAGIAISTAAPTSPSAGLAQVALARAYSLRGELGKAEDHARTAVKILRVEPAVSLLAFATLAAILMQRGELRDAANICADGLAILAEIGGSSTDVALLFAAAETNFALGDNATAQIQLREAARRLCRSAERIPNSLARSCYLQEVPLHAKLLARLQSQLGAAAKESLFAIP